MKRRGETNFYLCEVNRDMVIDATYKGNKSRFMNHSCQPNTEMQKWFSTSPLIKLPSTCKINFLLAMISHFRRVDGETRIGIFAIRNIKIGEPLTYDYQYGISVLSLITETLSKSGVMYT